MSYHRIGADFSWPTMAACGVVLGLVCAAQFGGFVQESVAGDKIREFFAWHRQAPEAATRQALIVTTDSRDRLTAVATLSPRGYHPLLAGSRQEVETQMAAHPGAVGLVVLDATLPDFPAIQQALTQSLPVGRIVILNAPHRTQDVGPILLARL